MRQTNSDFKVSHNNTKNKNLKKKEKLQSKEMKQNKKKEKTKRVENNKKEEESNAIPAKRQRIEPEEEEREETFRAKFLEISSSGFDWSSQNSKQINQEEESSSSEEEDEDDDDKKKSMKRLKKSEKSMKKILEEKKIREVEANPNQEPETAEDFELKVETNPDSTQDWIAYIGFYLENGETSKARAVASRGLKTMKSTLTEERLALWNVTLRLEVMYGKEESIQNTFQDAIALNDELKIYFMMIEIYFNANKVKEAKELLKKLVKKYSQARDVWVKAFNFCFKANEINEARTMLDKSLLSLPKKDHVEIINRFAQLELKHGDTERGKTIFEKLLSNFPKRLDVWNVYADLLIKLNDIEGARNILERITGLKLKMKPMRNAFKKLMEFEKQHGTPLRVEAVKKRVEEYVTAALKDDDE